MDWIQQYWIEFLFTATVSIFSAIARYVYKSVKAIKDGMQAILRDEIIALYNKCHDENIVKIYELENMEHLYTNYAMLGGNGVIKELYEDFKEIPVSKREHHNKED